MFEKKNNKTENQIVEKIREISPEVFCPVIFTSDDKYYKSPSLIDLPFEVSQILNLEVSNNNNLKVLNKYNLDLLERNNNYINERMVENYIIDNAFTTFCSAINLTMFSTSPFNTIPILQYVREYLTNSSQYLNIFQYIYSIKHSTSLLKEEDKIKEKQEFLTDISYQIVQEICLFICQACDRAVTDTIFNVYTVPNIKNIFKALGEIEEFIKGTRGIAEIDYPAFAASYLKSYLRDIIKEVIFEYVLPSTQNILFNCILSCYIVYNDYKEYNFKELDNKPQRKLIEDDSIDNLF